MIRANRAKITKTDKYGFLRKGAEVLYDTSRQLLFFASITVEYFTAMGGEFEEIEQDITIKEGEAPIPEEWIKVINALGYEICSKEAVEVAREAIELKKQTEVILEEEEYGEYVQDRIFDLYGKKQRNEKKCCVTCKYLKTQPSEAPCDRCKFRNKWEANDDNST